MGGVSVEGPKGGRRTLDSEINLIPMIDLFICCIAFLLITAVWSQLSRINANAQVPSPPRPDQEVDKVEPEKMLTVEMKQDDKFVLIWKSGATVHVTNEVRRQPVEVGEGSNSQVRYPDLANPVPDDQLVTVAIKDLPGLQKAFAGYPIKVRHNVKDVVILVCSPDGKYAWLEDASWTPGKVDHPWYLSTPPMPAEFTMDPDQRGKP